MPSPAIESLLILQDRDVKRLALEGQLKGVPRDIAAVEAKIAAEKASIEAAKQELRELEVKKKALENEIGSAEGKLAKYRTQQSMVKKNDEYQALGHEIETTEKAIGDFEGQELEIMYLIDEAKKKFVAAEAVLRRSPPMLILLVPLPPPSEPLEAPPPGPSATAEGSMVAYTLRKFSNGTTFACAPLPRI